MFSCYNQILVCGVHLWLIFFFIRKIPLQKNKWNFNVLQHDVPGVWRKLLRRTWRRRIQFTHLYGAEDKVCHIFGYSLSLSLSLSPLISLQVWIQKFWKWLRSKRGDEMNLKEIKHVYRLHLFQLFSSLNFYLCLVSVILLVFLFQKREWGGGGGGGCEAVQMRGHIFLKGSQGHITYSLVILVCVHEEKSWYKDISADVHEL